MRLLIALSCFYFIAIYLSSNLIDPANAHESRPLTVEVTERQKNLFGVEWSVPPSVAARNRPKVIMPLSCRRQLEGGTQASLYHCSQGLSGKKIKIEYPFYNPSISTFFRVKFTSGEKRSTILPPDKLVWDIPYQETFFSVAKSYFVLGMHHIFGGYDHLLFIACLVFIASSFGRILITITGFTVAHSLTLFLGAFDIVRIPVPPVEASIALSIVFLATEIVRRKKDTLTWRYPITVSSAFGLLHGLGFASALRETGLPQTDILSALLFFNAGIEIGQIIFVLVLVVASYLLISVAKLLTVHTSSMKEMTGLYSAYFIGTVSTFWMIERITGFWMA